MGTITSQRAVGVEELNFLVSKLNVTLMLLSKIDHLNSLVAKCNITNIP